VLAEFRSLSKGCDRGRSCAFFVTWGYVRTVDQEEGLRGLRWSVAKAKAHFETGGTDPPEYTVAIPGREWVLPGPIWRFRQRL